MRGNKLNLLSASRADFLAYIMGTFIRFAIAILSTYKTNSMLDCFKCDEDFNNYLYAITGFSYLFRVSSSREWDSSEEYGVFYQVRPKDKDDGFYDWYCYKIPNRQFFRTKTEAVLRFTMQWWEWHCTKGLSFFK